MALSDLTRTLAPLAAALLMASAPALGQQDLAPETIRQIGAITGEQATAVRDYVRANAANLASDDPEKVRADLAALRRPLEDSQVSVAFRRKYTEELLEILRPMVAPAAMSDAKNKKPIVAIALAGELATDPAAEICRAALAAPRADVRHQAATALRMTFIAIGASSSPPMQSSAVSGLLTQLAERVKVEPDGLVLMADVRALAAAAATPAFRDEAVTALSSSVSAISGKPGQGQLDVSHAEAILTAAIAVRDVLATPGVTLQPATAKAAAELGGFIVKFAARNVEGGKVPMQGKDPIRTNVADLAVTGQNLVLLAGQRLQPGWQAPSPPPLADDTLKALRDATREGDAKFALESANLVGDRGLLLSPPFGFPAGHFAR